MTEREFCEGYLAFLIDGPHDYVSHVFDSGAIFGAWFAGVISSEVRDSLKEIIDTRQYDRWLRFMSA